MLLSTVGETNRFVHKGAEIALALLSEPERSVVLRTLWRVKDKKLGPGLGKNARPDFQELLTGVRLSIWIRKGTEKNGLLERLRQAFSNPAGVSRFGGLALGESTHLVDEIRPWRPTDPDEGMLLVKAEGGGNITLPVWPDHVGSKGTKWGQFRIQPKNRLSSVPESGAWISILPEEG